MAEDKPKTQYATQDYEYNGSTREKYRRHSVVVEFEPIKHGHAYHIQGRFKNVVIAFVMLGPKPRDKYDDDERAIVELFDQLWDFLKRHE